MRAHPDPAQPAPAPQVNSVGLLLARLMWMLGGPLLLLVLLYWTVSTGRGWLTLWDGMYWVVTAAMIACRWLEIRSGVALTATGEPATWVHFRRYAEVLLAVAAVAWVAANLVGNHLLHGS